MRPVMQLGTGLCWIAPFLLTISACSDGDGFAFDGQNSGSGLQSGAVDARYISQLDTSATLHAVAAGINPRYEFIPDTFNCHDEEDNDFSSPDLVVQILADNTYVTSEGNGRFALEEDEVAPSNYYRFDGGPFGHDFFYLQFDNHGQAFNADYGDTELNCYQAGAREAKALKQFVLNTPVAGDYNCRDVETGNSTTLTLYDNLQYQVGNDVGEFSIAGITSRTASRLNFDSGTLDGQRAWYSEETESGYRKFAVSTTETFGIISPSVSSSLNLICEAFGPPVSFTHYGANPAPALSVPATSLSGFYYQDNILTSATVNYFESRYFYFEPGGYIHEGTPHVSGIDCSRTKPNGLAYCDAYVLQGNELQIHSNTNVDTFSITTSGSSVTSIDDEPVFPVQATGAGSIGGNWESLYYSQYGCFGGGCSTSFIENDFTFFGDGRFLRNTTSQSFNSLETAVATTSVSGFSDSSLTGQYSVSGNQLQLNFDNGRITRHFIYLSRPGFLAIDDLLYLTDRD